MKGLLNAFFAIALLALFGVMPAQAELTIPDTSTIVTNAETTVNSVTAIVAGAVGFFLVVKLVKWIKK